MNSLRALLSAILILSLSHCTTFEDRSACGCRLALNLDRVSEVLHPENALRLALDGPDGFSLSERLYSPDDGSPWSMMIRVPNGEYILSAATASLRIPTGEESPPLYLCRVFLDASGESLTHTVIVHKNYCQLTLVIKSAEGGDYPYSLDIEGNVDGCEPDGSPTEGPFRITAVPRVDGIVNVRIPRQIDNSLTVSFTLGENHLITFALGQYIAASGYDWTAPDLDDITIEIDWASTTLTFTIDAWTTVLPLDVWL